MLDAAISEVLVIGYAVHDDPLVSDSLARAAQRDVGITLLLEREIDTRATTNTVSRSQDCGAGSPGRQLIAPRPAPHSSTTSLYTCVSSDYRVRTLRRVLDATIEQALSFDEESS
jgi:hypothetical protein